MEISNQLRRVQNPKGFGGVLACAPIKTRAKPAPNERAETTYRTRVDKEMVCKSFDWVALSIVRGLTRML